MSYTDGRQGVCQTIGSVVELGVAVAVRSADGAELPGVRRMLREHVDHRHLVEQVEGRRVLCACHRRCHGSTTRDAL